MIRVLVVDDEELVAQAHAETVRQLDGFEVADVALSIQDASAALRRGGVDLVLLDMNLPDGHGLDLLRRVRAAGVRCDVIAVTAARDVDVVRSAVSTGVVAYLIKPFSQAALRERMLTYREYHRGLDADDDLDQDQVDAMIRSLRPQAPGRGLPKGLSAETLKHVEGVLADGVPLSAGEVAERIGGSRVTARRYLEHLVTTSRAARDTRLGRTGRPEVEYRLEG